MFDLTMHQFVKLWMALEDVYSNRSLGAEIYAYTLQPCSPAALLSSRNDPTGIAGGEAQECLAHIAGRNLQGVCELFMVKRDCKIEVEEQGYEWGDPIYHRAHLEVIPNAKSSKVKPPKGAKLL